MPRDNFDDLVIGNVGVNHTYVYYGRTTLAWAGFKPRRNA